MWRAGRGRLARRPGILGGFCSLQGPMLGGRRLVVHPTCQPWPGFGSIQCDQRPLRSSGSETSDPSPRHRLSNTRRFALDHAPASGSRFGTVKTMTSRSETAEDLTVPETHPPRPAHGRVYPARSARGAVRLVLSGRNGAQPDPRWRSCLRVALLAHPRFAQNARFAPPGPPCTLARQIVSRGPTKR